MSNPKLAGRFHLNLIPLIQRGFTRPYLIGTSMLLNLLLPISGSLLSATLLLLKRRVSRLPNLTQKSTMMSIMKKKRKNKFYKKLMTKVKKSYHQLSKLPLLNFLLRLKLLLRMSNVEQLLPSTNLKILQSRSKRDIRRRPTR